MSRQTQNTDTICQFFICRLCKHHKSLYFRFFETEPDMKAFFPKIVRMNNDSQLEWDVDREKLQKHAIRVMQGLGAAVDSLDDSDFLNSVLISVGQTHFHRQVRPTMLKVIKFPFKRKGLTSQNVRFLKSLLEDNNGQFKEDNKSTTLHLF